MVIFMVLYLERVKRERGLTAAQNQYRAWFSNGKYADEKVTVDIMLEVDHHGDIIVEV